MAQFTITIDDAITGGITAARDDFNASLPDDSKNVMATDVDYLSARVIAAVQSWADQWGISTSSQAQAKAAFLSSLPDDKQAAVAAALAPLVPNQ